MSAGKRHNLQGQVVRLEMIKLHLENEIERKKETINVMIDNEEEYCLEINKLNNIIKELEEWLEQEYAVAITNSIQEPNNPEWYIKWNERKNILDKIKELKGSDKE